jgi:hypothetical protein
LTCCRFGEPGQADVIVENGSAEAVDVDARLDVPAGWTSGTASGTVPAFGRATFHVPVTATGAPTVATITALASDARGQAQTDVLSAPRGDQVPIALDAGTATSPVLSSYTRLSPSDVWDAAQGFGWVGTPPQSRDRGTLDSLRRDLVTNTAPGTLRISVPAGNHTGYLLVGDAGFPADPMTVSSGGQTLLDLASPQPTGAFRWLVFPLNGGTSGRDVDLDFAAHVSGQFWRFAGLVVTP